MQALGVPWCPLWRPPGARMGEMEASGAMLVPGEELGFVAPRVSVSYGVGLRVSRGKGSRERVCALSDGICWR